MNKLPESVTVKNQSRKITREFYENGEPYLLDVDIQWDDSCNNGHNTFAITGELTKPHRNGRKSIVSCGCLHDEIAKHLPKLRPLLKWHLMSADGPLHYVSNALYHAGDRDCWGKKKGEPRQFEKRIVFVGKDKNGTDIDIPWTARIGSHSRFIAWIESNPEEMRDPRIVAVEHPPADYDYGEKYTLKGFECLWHQCPFDTHEEISRFISYWYRLSYRIDSIATAWGEGKETDLDAARSAAIWPDAELADFTREKLEARLPDLMAEFKKDIEEFGFEY